MFKSIKNRLKNQKGLTLIELLAVIVILGIIAAIAIPSIGGIINKSKDDAKVAEGIQIVNSAKLYMSTHAFNDGTTVDNKMQIDDLLLADYLDNVKDSDFSVEVTKTASGKYTYELIGHYSAAIITPANGTTPAATDVTEQNLLKY
jgi:type IV pilus assembly protein PilA